MDAERRELLEVLSLGRLLDPSSIAARAWSVASAAKPESDDLVADAIHIGLASPAGRASTVVLSSIDADATEALRSLNAQQRTALVLAYAKSWPTERIGRALGGDGAAILAAANEAVTPELQQRVAWEIGEQLGALTTDGEPMAHRTRRLMAFGGLVLIVAVVLGVLALTQRTINRPGLLQLQPTGLVAVATNGDVTRLLEEQVSVAIAADEQVLYQYSGGPGVAGGSIWYSEKPGERTGQVVAKTGGILGWIRPEDDPRAGSDLSEQPTRAVAIVADNQFDSGVVTSTYQLMILEPSTGETEVVATVGSSVGDGEQATSGTKPVRATYGAGRILVWMMDAVDLEGLPDVQPDSCGVWTVFDLSGTTIELDGLPDTIACHAPGEAVTAPTLSHDGLHLLWLSTTSSIESEDPPREGWLSRQSTTLHAYQLDTGREFAIALTDITQPTFWAQFTMSSQQTGTIFVDAEDTIVVVSIGIRNPQIAVVNYSTYIVDLVSERVEESVGDSPITFGH